MKAKYLLPLAAVLLVCMGGSAFAQTATATPSITATPSVTATPSQTPTSTPTWPLVATPTITATPSITPTSTTTVTATTTTTTSATPSPTPHPYINAASSNWSPIPVGTSTPVLVLYGRARCSWEMTWTGAGNLWCAPVPNNGNPAPVYGTSTWLTNASSTPDFTPANGVGHEFVATQAPWTSGGSLVADPSIGLKCVSDSGTLNVSTWEFVHCYAQRMGMP